MNNRVKKIGAVALIASSWALLFAVNSFAQDLSSGSSVFEFKRPGAAGSAPSKPSYRKQKQLPLRKRTSKAKKESTVSSKSKSKETPDPAALTVNEQLGITMWRLRPSTPSDTGARLLIMGGASKEPTNMVAERVGLETVFKKGEKVRISVESPRQGYVYIIDRELKKDNTVGDPYLIFPTLRTRGGDNYVGAGTVIEIPAQTDNPFYFDILPTDNSYAGELLTVLVSPTKLEGLPLGENPLKLSAKQVEDWEASWQRIATTFELDTGRDLTYTKEEQEAGMGDRMLTQMSPQPQTVISIESPKGKAFLVSFAMKVSN